MSEQQVVLNPEHNNPVVVSRSVYRDEERLDIRRYYYTRAGELRPTKKGVSLTLADGLATQALAALRTASTQPTTLCPESNYPVVIQRRQYKGREMLDIRRHYVDHGDLRPTRKGVALPCDTGLDQQVIATVEQFLTGA